MRLGFKQLFLYNHQKIGQCCREHRAAPSIQQPRQPQGEAGEQHEQDDQRGIGKQERHDAAIDGAELDIRKPSADDENCPLGHVNLKHGFAPFRYAYHYLVCVLRFILR